MNFRKFKIATLALILFVGIVSCNKDDGSPIDTNNPPETSKSFIRAKVNGKIKAADTKIKATFTDEQNVKAVVFSGNNGATQLISFGILVQDFRGVGTYELGFNTSLSSANYYETDFGTYLVGLYAKDSKGKVIVTEYTAGKSLKGTFELKSTKIGNPGNGPAQQDITNGEFNISLE